MSVELTNAYGAWCERDPDGECEVIGPYGCEFQAQDALDEHHESEHPNWQKPGATS